MLEPGEVIDSRYRVVRELGEGGMGTVFLVEHVDLHSKHALKVLASQLFFKKGMRDRFLQEGRVMAELQHPNIARVTDLVSSHIAGLVMEFVDGPTLDAWIDEQGAQDLATCRRILLPLLGAVGAAHGHAHRIIHRDLKPENIILSSEPGGAQRPVILDFGIAKMLGGDDDDRKVRTGTGTGMGTPGYMAPEQIKNARNADERSDIYSLGVVLHELATGEPAFTGESEFEIGMAVVSGKSRGLPQGLDPVLRTCIQRATQVDPVRRFQSCQDFARALNQKTAPTEVISTKRPSPAPPVPPPPHVLAPAPPPPAGDVEEEWEREKKSSGLGGLLAAGGLGGLVLAGLLVVGCLGVGLALVTSGDKASSAVSPPSPSVSGSSSTSGQSTTSSPTTTSPTEVVASTPPADPSVSQATGMDFVRVPSGEFWMGDGKYKDEPRHKVSISSDFWLGRTEVTQDQYRSVAGYNPSSSTGGSRPVHEVSWLEVIEFLNTLSDLDGYRRVYTVRGNSVTADWSANGYRLPTAAEWEFAAQSAGKQSTEYAGSDSYSGVAWTKDNASGRPHDVATKKPNLLGLYDMSGNVYEWVWDWCVCHEKDDYCPSQISNSGGSVDPRGPTSNRGSKVKKGGSYKFPAVSSRVANLAYYDYQKGWAETGFRVARNAN